MSSQASVAADVRLSNQEMAWNMGGTVSKCDHREYGFAQLQVVKSEGESQSSSSGVDALFEGLGDDMQVRSNYL